MKVHELLKLLGDFPMEFDIILQKDAEGNGFSKLAGVSDAIYENDEEVYGPESDDDSKINCVVLWPVN